MATAAPFSAQWTPDLIPIARRMTGLSEQLVKAIRRGLQENARLMAGELRRLTPRSPTDGAHMADGWGVRRLEGVEAGGADFAIEVFNADPRWDRTIQLASGGVTSLGFILEFGSQPHKIEARPGGTLSFFWPKIGSVVNVQSVEHPGTRPYGMMVVSTDAAISRAQRLLVAAAKVLQTGGQF